MIARCNHDPLLSLCDVCTRDNRIEKLEAQLESMTANYNKSDIDLECENFKLKKQLVTWKRIAGKRNSRIEKLQSQLEAVRTHTFVDLEQKRFEELEARLAELKPYLRHNTPNNHCDYMKHSDYPCTCGLQDILDKDKES